MYIGRVSVGSVSFYFLFFFADARIALVFHVGTSRSQMCILSRWGHKKPANHKQTISTLPLCSSAAPPAYVKRTNTNVPASLQFFFFFCGLLSSQWTFYYSYFFSISRLNHLPLSPGWPFGSLVCKMSGMVQGISVSASVFTLVAIAVDRYDSRCPHAHHHTPRLCVSRLFLFDCRLGRMQRSLLGEIPISSDRWSVLFCEPAQACEPPLWRSDHIPLYSTKHHPLLISAVQRSHTASNPINQLPPLKQQ